MLLRVREYGALSNAGMENDGPNNRAEKKQQDRAKICRSMKTFRPRSLLKSSLSPAVWSSSMPTSYANAFGR